MSWVGSLAAAALGFWIGKTVGAERLRRLDAKLIRRISAAVRKNGFMTSLVVRLVPTGPAILVNLAAGVSRMKFRHFVAGTGIGIIPKIIVVCLISQGLISGLSGSLMAVFFAGWQGLRFSSLGRPASAWKRVRIYKAKKCSEFADKACR